MKESVTKFDLEAAFKALDEIEVPAANDGVKANKPALTEIFSRKTKFDALMEEYYDISDSNGLNDAKDAREAEIAKAKLARIEKIVDLDAKTPEDLLTTYVGKFIIQCPQCMTLFYKDTEDVEESEDDANVVNVSEVCQHCGNDSGYNLIGKVGEAAPEEMDEFDTSELDVETEETAEEGTETTEDNELTLDVDGTDEEEPTEEDDLDLDLDAIEDEEAEEAEEDDKKEESFSTEHENVLIEQLTESSDIETSAEDFEKLIKSPEFKKPISDTAARAMMQEFDESCNETGCKEGMEATASNLTEGAGADTANAIKDALNSASKEDDKAWAKTVTEVIEILPDSCLDDLYDIIKDKLANVKLDQTEVKEVTKAINDADTETDGIDSVGKLLALYDINTWDANTVKTVIVVLLGIVAVLEPTPVVEIITTIVMALPADAIKNVVALINNLNPGIVLVNKLIDMVSEKTSSTDESEVTTEALTEGGLGTLAKAIGKKIGNASKAIKDKASKAIDNFADSANTREEKANWILASARKDYSKIELDKSGNLIPDEGNQKFKVFLVIGYKDKYSDGKPITMPPSDDNPDLIAGMEAPKAFKDYKAAEDSAKGWSMQQGHGPAFIYIAADEDDEKALVVCQYFKGELKNDKLEKMYALVKKDIDGAGLEAKHAKNDTATQKAGKSEEVKTVATKATAVKQGAKIKYGDAIAEVTQVADAKNSRAITITYDDGNTEVLNVKPVATLMVVVESVENNNSDLTTFMESLDEVQESTLEALISESLLESFKNVAGFRLSDCSYSNDCLVVNGTIHFTSGKTRKTTYSFTEAFKDNSGIVTLQGINEKLGLDKKFELVGRTENKTLITESFKRI